jgi:peptidoglycan/xylan/chitin deacetylase (PgdA/CDA1 family)
VINYEAGGENNILHGDAASEAFLSEIVGAAPWPGMRHMNTESIYEYGSRAGFWRLHRLFTERSVPGSVYAVATAMARNREAVAAMNEARWEIATHGLKWIDCRDIAAEVEALHIAEAVRIIATSQAPARSSVPTNALVKGVNVRRRARPPRAGLQLCPLSRLHYSTR